MILKHLLSLLPLMGLFALSISPATAESMPKIKLSVIKAVNEPEVRENAEKYADRINQVIAHDKKLFDTTGMEPCPGDTTSVWRNMAKRTEAKASFTITYLESEIYMISGECPTNDRFNGPVEYISKVRQEFQSSPDMLTDTYTENHYTGVYINGAPVGTLTDMSYGRLQYYKILTSGERIKFNMPGIGDKPTFSASTRYATLDVNGNIVGSDITLTMTSIPPNYAMIHVSRPTGEGRYKTTTYVDGKISSIMRIKNGAPHGWYEIPAVKSEAGRICWQNGEIVKDTVCPDN